MRYAVRVGLAVFLILGAGAGGWWYANRHAIDRRRAVLRVAQAPSLALAQPQLLWFETPPDVDEKLAALVNHWGTGDARFDDLLVQHLGDPACGDALRKRFAEELAWRPAARPLWAQAWRQRTRQPPDQEIAAILDFLEALAAADAPPRLSWRQVLDVQAVFELEGRGELAAWLTPENCLPRYRAWKTRGDK